MNTVAARFDPRRDRWPGWLVDSDQVDECSRRRHTGIIAPDQFWEPVRRHGLRSVPPKGPQEVTAGFANPRSARGRIARMVFLTVRLVVSVVLIALGVGIALDYRGAAARVAAAIAGPAIQGPDRPSAGRDRFWAVLPLALGIGEPLAIVLGRVSPSMAVIIGVLPVLFYFVTMMWLGWIYTPPRRRAIGPLFWTRRAAAIPAVGFFVYAGGLSILFAVPAFR